MHEDAVPHSQLISSSIWQMTGEMALLLLLSAYFPYHAWILISLMLQVFEAAPQDVRGVPAKKAAPDYFL